MKSLQKTLILVATILFSGMMLAQDMAVTAWDRIGIMSGPSKTSSQIAAIHFGTDEVRLTLETLQVQEDKKRTYVKVVLPNGTEGWVNQYLLIPNGSAAVVKTYSNVYQNPVDGVTMVRGVDFDAGEPVILTLFSGPYAYLTAKEKKKAGWVLAENLIFGSDEVKFALSLQKAKAEKDVNKRIQKIQDIRNHQAYPYAQMYALVEAAYHESYDLVTQPQSLVADVTDNRSISNPAQRVAAAPNSNRGLTEQPLKAGDKLDDVVVVDGVSYYKHQSSLVLVKVIDPGKPATGRLECYHKTLPVGSKISMLFPDNPGYVELEVVGNLSQNEGLGMTGATLSRLFGSTVPEGVMIEYYTY